MKIFFLITFVIVPLTSVLTATSFGGSFTISGDKFYFPDGTFFTTAPKDGKSILNGSGVPAVAGNIGDFYIDTSSNRLYGPFAGSWGAGVSLVGPQGVSGANGFNSLLLLSDEPAGSNCGNGGLKVQAGLDQNRNGILDAEEVAQKKYYCTPDAAINKVLIGTYVGTVTASGMTMATVQYSIDANGVLSGTIVDISDNNRPYPIRGTVNMMTGSLYIVFGLFDGSIVSISGTPTGGSWTASTTPNSNGGIGLYTAVKQ